MTFEIRVICTPADADRITTALAGAFTTGPVRSHPTRRSHDHRVRLYLTADHTPPGTWPTPEQAYATAPSIVHEIGWTADQAARTPFGEHLDRDYWLRKAAALDRIALDSGDTDAEAAAVHAAEQLMDLDQPGAICDPRHYVRQQYHRWADSQ